MPMLRTVPPVGIGIPGQTRLDAYVSLFLTLEIEVICMLGLISTMP